MATSRQYGIEPQQLFSYLRRTTSCRPCSPTCGAALAIAAVVEAATVTDTDGNTIDTSEFFGKGPEADEADGARPRRPTSRAEADAEEAGSDGSTPRTSPNDRR